MIGVCTPIKNDLYDIAARLAEIDRGYFVVYNYKRRRYEVHNRRQKGDSLCVAVPFGRLDARTLTLVRKTAAERADKLFAEIDRENALIEKRQNEAIIKAAEFRAERALAGLSDPEEERNENN